MRRAVLIALLVAIAGCEDNDQRARALGREARVDARRACARADVRADAADADDEALRVEACFADACEARCKKAGGASFRRTCAEVCMVHGGCQSNDDCGPGLTCVAVAPVVCRCIAVASDAGT